MTNDFIHVVHANEHNLKNLSADIPLNALTVVTGVSGSGKSTLAFDIIFASGQSRFLECVNAYARQFVQSKPKADYEELKNLPPTVAIEQRLSQGSWKSTVATTTELLNNLRLLFMTLGKSDLKNIEVTPHLFSFNTILGSCPACNGYGYCDSETAHRHGASLEERLRELAQEKEDREGAPRAAKSFADIVRDPKNLGEEKPCPLCNGTRFSPEALSFRFHGLTIGDFVKFSIDEFVAWVKKFKPTKRELAIAGEIFKDMESRLTFLQQVGLGYLTLDRAIPTLSGGESQRIRLATQLGSNLCGVCYILDEPTIGLHPRDTKILLDALTSLRDKGNTVIMVEHDEQTMRRADWICDLGPGAGRNGGRLLVQGPLKEILRSKESQTARILNHPIAHPTRKSYRAIDSASEFLCIHEASLHNLKNVSVKIPLRRFTVVTGVSGSGKSTLIRNILYKSLEPLTGHNKPVFVGCKKITGYESIKRVLEVDQTPIGRTPASCPATYVDFFTDIRKLFAATKEARLRGWSQNRFSFNIKNGQCPACKGQGVIRSEMAFLPDVVTPCDVCNGARYNPETLLVKWNGKTIADVLSMSIAEAAEFFVDLPKIHDPLQMLVDVGLGYLSLGQQSSTLSGGEAQRIKLVTELTRCRLSLEDRLKVPTLYILDEPTVGLHTADVENLLHVIHQLVEAGHTIVMIEHNTDMMLDADYLIDLGPEGGEDGGRIVAEGPLPTLLKDKTVKSHTLDVIRNAECGMRNY